MLGETGIAKKVQHANIANARPGDQLVLAERGGFDGEVVVVFGQICG
jgi:hypothetical protein